MKTGEIVILFLIIFLMGSSAVDVLAVPPPPAAAQCRITCRVAEIVEWSDASFPDIDLGELNPKKTQSQAQSALTLYTNGDVIITADNSSSAELSSGSHKLQTSYQLRCSVAQQEITTEWCTFDTFLKEAAEITHNQTEGAIVVVLAVKAEVKEIKPETTGEYYATQTLTACWKS